MMPADTLLTLPGSKSITNRALLLAALGEDDVTLENALFSEDSRHMLNALTQLGFDAVSEESRLRMRVRGSGGRIPAQTANLFIGNAGTAARFLTAALTLGRGQFTVDGEPRMRERPIADLVNALNALGARVHAPSGCPPVEILANGLPGGYAEVRGEISSQFLSALLMVAPYAQQPVTLRVRGTLNSRPYVAMTVAMMRAFGGAVETEGEDIFRVQPGTYKPPRIYTVEPDASGASYFFGLPALIGGSIVIKDLFRSSLQGDVAFVDVLAQMGCTVDETPQGLRVRAPQNGLRGVDVDLRDIPDTAQTLAALAPFAATPTRIRGIASARLKESDRVGATCAELRRLGVQVEEFADGMLIYPCAQFAPVQLQTYNDHRMAMAFALLALRAPGVTLENPGCVAKTFPNFFEVLGSVVG